MNNKKSESLSFLGHLEVLRNHLIRIAIAVLLCAIVAFIYKDFIFNAIIFAPKHPDFLTNRFFCWAAHYFNLPSLCLNQHGFDIINIKMAGQFMAHIKVSLVFGLILAFPYILLQFWHFLSPALLVHEKKHMRGILFWGSLLFFIGILFGYYIVTPLSLEFLSSYSIGGQVENQIILESYIPLITSVVFSCGVIFELPLLIYFLSRLGIVTASFLRKYRKHAIVILLTVSAIITPPDIFSQLVVVIPLLILYEASIFIAKNPST